MAFLGGITINSQQSYLNLFAYVVSPPGCGKSCVLAFLSLTDAVLFILFLEGIWE